MKVDIIDKTKDYMEVDSGRQPFCILSLVQFMSLTSDIHVLPIFAPALKRGIDLS